MEFQWEQLLITLLWIMIVVGGIFTGKKWLLITALIIAIIMFTMNPFRTTVNTVNSAVGTNNFDDIPEKVVVESMSFEDHQKSKMDTLKLNQENTHEENIN